MIASRRQQLQARAHLHGCQAWVAYAGRDPCSVGLHVAIFCGRTASCRQAPPDLNSAPLMAAAFSAAGRRLLKLPQAQPFLFGAGFSCCKTAFADYLVQTQIERREKYDYKRTAAFASFGLVYLGGFQYFLVSQRLSTPSQHAVLRSPVHEA